MAPFDFGGKILTDENCRFCDDFEVRRVRKNLELAKFAFHVRMYRGVGMLYPKFFLFSSKNGDDRQKVVSRVRGLSS
jgi:hypothetical protein